MDPRLRVCPRATGADDALARVGADEAVQVASRVVAQFAERLRSERHVVAYFDAAGVMLTVDGDARTRSRLEDVNFAPGACWAEKTAGTNGPGTALVEGRAVEVFAAEHFVEAWQPWTCASVPVRFGHRVIGVVDITSPWKARAPSLLLAAEALAQAIEARLEAELATTKNAVLLQVARDALQARDDFLTAASHELKTPLTPLRVELQQARRLLERAGAHADGARIEQALRGADVHVGRLVKVIDQLLETSRIVREPLRPTLETFDLASAVRASVDLQRSELERLGCQVIVEAAHEVVGRWDRALLERAFEHVLGNAIKYAPGRIEMEVDADRARAFVRVRDHGPGIAPRDQERIFEPHERAVSCRNVAGFGLGLHAVRRIVEAHGGAIRLESTPGKGSTFVLELPLLEVEHDAARAIAVR